MRWQEIDDLRYRGSLFYGEQIILFGAGRKIRVAMFFDGYDTIEKLLDKYHPEPYRRKAEMEG